jgi:hypothetical protein
MHHPAHFRPVSEYHNCRVVTACAVTRPLPEIGKERGTHSEWVQATQTYKALRLR